MCTTFALEFSAVELKQIGGYFLLLLRCKALPRVTYCNAKYTHNLLKVLNHEFRRDCSNNS